MRIKTIATFIVGAIVGIALFAYFQSHRPAMPGVAAASSTHSTTAALKKLWHCGMHTQVIQDHPGNCPICHMALTPLKDDAASASTGERKVLYWWDPMLGPSSISDKPGKSAMGMDRVPVYAESLSAGPRVTIDPTIVQNMGVRTALVTRGPLDVTLRAVGVLKAPEPGLHDVSLKINGWIDTLHADTDGMHVHKGESLFELYSPDLQVAAEELISAVHSLKMLEPTASDVVKKEAAGLIASAKRKLRLWDIADEDIEAIAKADHAPKTIPIRSPADGDLVEKMIVQGSSVQMGMKLLRIEDHTTMWLDAEIYEDQLSMISIGQRVEATIDSVPGKTFTGKVSFLHPHVDHMTRTETVRAILENPGMKLHPGMYATVMLVARPVTDAILVPREAVIDTGTRQIAFVAEGDGHFDPRKVRMGIAGDQGLVQILEGLVPGESVVTSGQFLMDVESRTKEAVEKLQHPESPTTRMLP